MGRPDTARQASAAVAATLYGLATAAVRRVPRDLSLTSAAALATLDRTGPRLRQQSPIRPGRPPERRAQRRRADDLEQ